MEITRKDAYWNITATSVKLFSGLILLLVITPLIPPQEMGIWIIFQTYSSFLLLLDFGFSNSFTRNITYIFSGTKKLLKSGFEEVDKNDNSIDFGLLKGTIKAMKYYYRSVSLIFIGLTSVFGSIQIYYIVNTKFTGDQTRIFIAWGAYILLLSFQLYTLYFDSLLSGRGLIKKQKKIVIISQIVYLISTVTCIFFGLGVLSMVIGLMLSIPLTRYLSKLAFFDSEIVKALENSISVDYKELIKTFSFNSIKLGLTSLGSFLVDKSIILIGALYLPLSTTGSYGLTRNMLDIIVSLSLVWFQTFYPKITNFKLKKDINGVKRLYIKSWLFYTFVFLGSSMILLFFANDVLNLIHSKNQLLSFYLFLTLIIVVYLENNHAMAGGLLLIDNEVPFFKAALFAGGLTIILFFVLNKYFNIGIWSMVLAPGLSQIVYQNWRWPMKIIVKYKFKLKDIHKTVSELIKDYAK